MSKSEQENTLDPELQRICDACHHDPFAVLGRHTKDGSTLIRCLGPPILSVHRLDRKLLNR